MNWPRIRFVIAHPIRVRRFVKAANAPWPVDA